MPAAAKTSLLLVDEDGGVGVDTEAAHGTGQTLGSGTRVTTTGMGPGTGLGAGGWRFGQLGVDVNEAGTRKVTGLEGSQAPTMLAEPVAGVDDDESPRQARGTQQRGDVSGRNQFGVRRGHQDSSLSGRVSATTVCERSFVMRSRWCLRHSTS